MFLTGLRRLLQLGPRSARPASRLTSRRRRVAPRLAVERLEGRVVPAFGLPKLAQGSSGLEDYLYTAGDKVVPLGASVDAGRYYDIVVTDGSGVRHNAFARTAAGNFATTDNGYTLQVTDPASAARPWTFTLREFADATTTTVLKSASKTFSVAQATVYADAGLSALQSSFGAGATAYVRVTGLVPGQNDWSTTWLLPNGTTAAANTAGHDRPDSNSSGVLAAGSYLQYAPQLANGGASQWNRQPNYETKGTPNFQPFGSGNQGTWKLKLQKDSTHFVTLSVFTVDAAVPAAPVVISPPSPVTINAATYTISGTAEANALVRVWVDANGNGVKDPGETTLAGSQQLSGGATNYAISVPLSQDAANRFVVTATDAAKNESAAAAVPTLTEDSTAPPAPTVTSPAGPVALNAATATISGAAAGGSLVRVWVDANGNGVKDPGEALAGSQQLAAAATNYAIGVTLGQNAANSFVVTATDGAANESAAVAVPTITEDSLAPATPVVTNPAAADTTNDVTYTLLGTAEANALVRVWVDANGNGVKDPGETTLAGSQQLTGGATGYLITVPLSVGAVNNFVVTATDAAGNESAAADVLPITQDPTTPPAPALGSPAGPVSVNTSTYTITGTAAVGTLVKVWKDANNDGVVDAGDTLVGSQQLAGGAADFAVTVTLAQNADNNFLVTATNTTTNKQSAAAEVPTITEDSVAPAAPSTPALDPGSDSGVPGDNITGDNTPAFAGTAEPNSTVTVSSDGTAVGSGSADGSGNWVVSVDPGNPLADGGHSITARATDAAGNTGPVSGALSVTVDTTPPAADAGADQTVNEGDAVTLNGTFTDSPGNNGTPAFNWHLVSSSNGQAVADGSGQSFGFTPDDSGTYTFTFTVTDAAGNPGSGTVVVTANNVAPTATFSAPAAVDEGGAITLSLTNPSDPSGADTAAGFTYAFDLGDGAGYGAFGPGNSVSAPATTNGTRTVRGQIRDKDGGVTEYTATVTVNNVAPAVTAAGGQGADEGAATSFDLGSFADPGADGPWAVAVDWGDGSPPTTFSAAAPGALAAQGHAYADDGAYTATVTVTDAGGASGSATFAVAVANVAPTATINGAPTNSLAGTAISLTSTVSDPSSTDTAAGFAYAWSVTKDGAAYAAATTPAFSFTPDGSGTYVVTLQVTDKDGGQGSDSKTVAVQDPVIPPPPGGTGTNPGPVVSGVRDVTAQVKVILGKVRRRHAGNYQQSVTLQNVGGTPLAGPLTLVLGGLSRKVRIAGRIGLTQSQVALGSPYVNVDLGGRGALGPGATVSLVLAFRSRRSRLIRYAPHVLAGSGVR